MSNFALVSSKYLLDIKTTIVREFTLKRVCDMITRYSQMDWTDKFWQRSLFIWPVQLTGWMFVYELSGCGLESCCSHLNFRSQPCFEQVLLWHSSNYRVSIHSETRSWHDNNIQSNVLYIWIFITQLNHLAIWAKWLNVDLQTGCCGMESCCSNLNFTLCFCFEQGVLWHSGNYRVWIHSETHTWHDNITQ